MVMWVPVGYTMQGCYMPNQLQQACPGFVDVPEEQPATSRRSQQGRREAKKIGTGARITGDFISPDCVGNRTTVMLRNLPNNYTSTMVLAMLDQEGFAGLYDFFYLPIDFKSHACLGYAFINLVDPSYVPAFWNKFHGYSNWILPSRKICSVTWSGPHQGLEAHAERYRNSPLMHESIPDGYKPMMFKAGVQGVRVPFAPPTKAPRAPRVRNYPQAAKVGGAQWYGK